MPRQRRPPPLELNRIAASPDGLTTRSAGPWARDKLAIISAYCREFTKACKDAISGGVYADAFCGPGINQVRESDDHLWGSGMLAVRTEPRFGRLYLMDKSADNIAALKKRVGPDARVHVRQGDANHDFVPMLQSVLESRAPMFCVLDPQGIELLWTTVAALAQRRIGAKRPELLILLSDSMGYMRLLPVTGSPSEKTLHNMTVFFATGEWRTIHEWKQQGKVTATEARELYAALYQEQLRALGYTCVLHRDVGTQGHRGRPLYQLIFATESEAGERIMSYIFEHMTPQKSQLSLF